MVLKANGSGELECKILEQKRVGQVKYKKCAERMKIERENMEENLNYKMKM